MHNCIVEKKGESLYEKDVDKFIQRWNLHPEYAEALNSWYQNLLKQYEAFSDEQATRISKEDSFGVGRKESAVVLTGLMNDLKRHAREWMDKHTKGLSRLS